MNESSIASSILSKMVARGLRAAAIPSAIFGEVLWRIEVVVVRQRVYSPRLAVVQSPGRRVYLGREH